MKCRNCGACCIIPSISSPIPGMENGKPAGVKCIHLTKDNLCAIYYHPERPAVCDQFLADILVCGNSGTEARKNLRKLEESFQVDCVTNHEN